MADEMAVMNCYSVSEVRRVSTDLKVEYKYSAFSFDTRYTDHPRVAKN
jgi:hypothetical protein